MNPVVSIDSEVTRLIRQHARAHMAAEVCGVLIGDDDASGTVVLACIEATNAAQAGTHVTFTQDAWESIYRVKDERYPDKRIVGWYHSHPGFGVFLSDHDTFIHRNFFSSPGQVAWVYDPHTDEEGCFGWIDGDIHRLQGFSVVDNGGDGVELVEKEPEAPEVVLPQSPEKTPSPWGRRGVAALKYFCVFVLGFAIAYFLFPHFLLVTIDPRTGEPRVVMPVPATGDPGSDLHPRGKDQ
jgi:proteasome lid subunit RPN8/RPN11